MLALDRQTGQAVLVLNSSTRSVDDPALQLAAAHPRLSWKPPYHPGPAWDRSLPSFSAWCSSWPASSPCSEPGTGSLPSAVPSTPPLGRCC
jgi:hypothetical protein